MDAASPYIELLKNRINLREIPFTDRGSRLLVYRSDHYLSVRLAERWFKREHQLSSYRQRLPMVDEWKFTDGEGNPLDFQMTSYPHRIDFQTTVGVFSLSFVDTETLLFTLPQVQCGFHFLVRMDKAQTDRRGGVLHLTGDIRRNIAYTTNARILVNTIEPYGPETQKINLIVDAGPYARADADVRPALLLNITPRLGFNRYIQNPDAALEASARRWNEWFSAVPPVAEQYRAQYYHAWWVMRAGLISTRFYTTREAMTPSKSYYVGIWQWDAFFHALAYRYVDLHLAHDQLRILLDHQLENGMIPDAIHDEGTVTHLTFPIEADVTKPPLLAWAVWKLHEDSPDPEFLNEVYSGIVRWNNWWFEHSDSGENGLCEYRHPYSSGLDDSPLWDEGMPVESPDLNTYLFLQQESLARIARAIGEEKDAEMWAKRAENMVQCMIQSMWDPKSGFFWAKRGGKRVEVRTPFGLFPLITGKLPKEITARLVEHLTNEKEFWTRYPVPTVSIDDPKYDPFQMWRGPTWVNVNYLLIEGLKRSGYAELGRELRNRTLDMMSNRTDIYEYYHPETGENPPKAAPIFGWSSAIFIDLAIRASREIEQKT
jgi:hypothetical protein